jgi:hypothetical protein
MADGIERDKLHKAFQYLASDAGAGALDTLHKGLEEFRGQLGDIKLNDAEFKYLSSALMTQRSNDFGNGIPLQAEGVPARSFSAAVNLRHGFVVKAKI